MRGQTKRSSNPMTGTGRPIYTRTTTLFHRIRSSFLTSFLNRPNSLSFLLSIFLFLAWISLRAHRPSSHPLPHPSLNDDAMANLRHFSSLTVPSRVAKDNRGWLLDPISLALAFGLSSGAVTCDSLHVGEIRPGTFRGNHRHRDCNETFVIWGAATRFRVCFSLLLALFDSSTATIHLRECNL